jgi:hypothetical protein
MQIEKPFDNEIVVIKNFLDQKTIDKIMFLASALDEEDWAKLNDEACDDYQNKIHPIQCSPDGTGKHIDRETISKITDDARNVFFSIYKNEEKILRLSDFGILSRTFGNGMGEHSDVGDNDPHQTRFGLVLYLNTQNKDFTGGELHYTKLGISYFPVAGDLVIHPGSEEYSHEVKDVTSGVRYMMSSFAKTIVPVF